MEQQHGWKVTVNGGGKQREGWLKKRTYQRPGLRGNTEQYAAADPGKKLYCSKNVYKAKIKPFDRGHTR